MSNFILAIDQGTTGSTALIIDMSNNGQVVGRANIEFPQHYPKAGWVEHDLDEIWKSVCTAVKSAVESATATEPAFNASKIAGIGLTNQRETLCFYERGSGRALRKAIVWQCRRSSDICAKLRADGAEKYIRESTGLMLDPYFSASKVRWVIENEPDLAGQISKGKALVSTIDSFLLYRLSSSQSFVTEPSNASRTMLFNIKDGVYDPELIKIFRLPSASALPEIKDSAGVFGVTKGLDFLPDGIPITGIAGDQQAALAGQLCFDKGEAKCTYGTGAFLLMNTGSDILRSTTGLITTVAWQLKGKRTYCFEGSTFVAGAAVQFLRDQLGFISHAKETETMALTVTAAPEIYFVPALTGLGAPYWNAEARGSFFGLTRGTTKAQLVRAALEAIAFQVGDLLGAMAIDAPGILKILRVDGGACSNSLLMQIQSNISNIRVERPANLETTALGASWFAALGSGICSSIEDLKRMRTGTQAFAPEASFDEVRPKFVSKWKRAVQAVELYSGT